MALWRIEANGRTRLAVGAPDEGPRRLLEDGLTLAHILNGSGPGLAELNTISGLEAIRAEVSVRPPIDAQPVWAAGVTFERSRSARKEESNSGDYYDHVYDAARPELFPKAQPGSAQGPDDSIAIRADSSWNVPEPELGLVLSSDAEIVGYVLADDVSSRSIEGENPLYLPQAKCYDFSCALGPCIVAIDEAPPFEDIEMFLSIRRAGDVIFKDTVSLAQMRRSPEELANWLFLAHSFPHGVVLLTGTSIVPNTDVTLKSGDQVVISANGLGTLQNSVVTVGRAAP